MAVVSRLIGPDQSGKLLRRKTRRGSAGLPNHWRQILSEFTVTASGLRYNDTVVGDGDTAKGGETAVVHYTGWLYNGGEKGKKFDSSVDRGEPFRFPLGARRVIAGWDEGVKGMQVGGKRTLVLPPDLGYGARGAPGAIPPNATLMFDVELLGLE
jgi:peptidylprolyl isomerase